MSPRDTLLVQVSALRNDLNHQLAKFDRTAAPAIEGKVNGEANDLVLAQLRKKISAQVNKLDELIRFDLAGDDLKPARTSYREIDNNARSLFAECLAISIAPAIRGLSLDDGACSIIERLLRGLGNSVGVPWPHLTTIADSEFFAIASQVIHLRYPASTIWDYPVAAHEFGHFVGPRWPSTDGGFTGYQVFLAVTELGFKSHREEYFADLFATYVLGPAYVDTCLVSRFDPAGEGDESHPSDRHRAVWILTGLELLAEQSTGQSAQILKSIWENRSGEWAEAVKLNEGIPVDVDFAAILRTRARDLWRSFVEWSNEAALTDLTCAMELRANFMEKEKTVKVLSIRDILNAAWLIRLGKKFNLRDPQDREVAHRNNLLPLMTGRRRCA